VSRRQQTMRMLRLPALLCCAAALSLAGCATGPGAETAQQQAGINGASGEIGPIALRDTVLAYPGGDDVFGYRAGENAPLGVTIVNTSDTPDQLVSVTSPVASSVTIVGRTIVAGGDAVSTIADATAIGPGAPGPAPAQQLRIVLVQLREPIRPGLNTPVTFRFREAGEMTLPVPIDAPVGVAPAEAGIEAGHHSG
jgi:copper(I)-binding protein